MQLKVEVKHEIIRTFTPYTHVLIYIYMYPTLTNYKGYYKPVDTLVVLPL